MGECIINFFKKIIYGQIHQCYEYEMLIIVSSTIKWPIDQILIVAKLSQIVHIWSRRKHCITNIYNAAPFFFLQV